VISVCFITKNEERWLGECIDHLKPIVKEFIVVDTGSTDRTIEIAKSHGALVSEIPWPNDFSAARNVSISKATQPWILKVDPDERLDPKDFEKLVALTKNESPYFAYQFWTRAYTNDQSRIMLASYQICRSEYPEREAGYQGFVTYPSIRLYRNLPFVKFHGKIHETVEPSLPKMPDGRAAVSPPQEIYFHHYGHTDEMTAEKQKNPLYQKLIREELERNPSNWYVLFELGNAHFQQGEYAEAIIAYERADKALPQKPQVLSNLGYALILTGKRVEGEKILYDCLEVDPHYHDAHLNLGASAFDTGDFQRALQHFDACLKIQPSSFMALRAKAQTLAQLGEIRDAETIFKQVLKMIPHFHEARVDLAILLAHTNRKAEAKAEAAQVLAIMPQHSRAKALAASL
jgi:tetratricopeptide (TPR) repeat protein